ncbi:DUF6418 domain-containing protein [Enterobacter cloacae]|uniref:DUF6418 domain-containing protein n=1 Tax=Enterobacter cloacae TaxID=550 RepID=UPI00339C7BD9|nr:hypothetical protein [Enterobacter cloacae]
MIIIIFLWALVSFAGLMYQGGSHIINIAAVLMVCLTGLIIIKRGKDLGVIALGLIISYVSASILCAYAETGAWFSEANIIASLSGATVRNSSLAAAIMLSAYYSYNSLSNIVTLKGGISKSLNSLLLSACCLISAMLSIILICINIKYGHPNDYNVDRFYYWEHIAPAWGEYVNFMSTQMAVFLGLAYGCRKSRMYLGIFLFSLLAQYMVGEKATGLYASLLMFIIPLFISRNIHLGTVIFKPRFVVASLIIVSALVCAIYLSYAAMGGEENAIAMLLNRLVLQSQMWWTVDSISDGGIAYDGIKQAIFGGSDGISGIQYLMREVADPTTFAWFQDKGVNWTMASPANLTYLFGYGMAFIPAISIGVMFGISSHIVVKAIVFKDVILIFLSIKLYNGVWQAATMGNIDSLLSMKILFVLVVTVFYIIASRIIPRDYAIR